MIHANLKILRKQKGITQAAIAEAVGVSRSQWAGYELNINPPLEVLVRISDFLTVSIDTLVRIDLSKFSETRLASMLDDQSKISGEHIRVLATTVDHRGHEQIEMVPVRAKASYLAGFADPEYISELPRLSIPFLPQGKKYRVFQVDGDSMLPIPDGAYIVCEYVENWQSIQDGEKYVIIAANEGITFKIAYNHIKSKEEILLCSSNPIFAPFVVPIRSVSEVWKYKLVMAEHLG